MGLIGLQGLGFQIVTRTATGCMGSDLEVRIRGSGGLKLGFRVGLQFLQLSDDVLPTHV